MQNNMLIFISTFGKKTIKIRNSIQIEVGCNKRNNYVYELKDNTLDNISDENPYYGELTGLYWVWKNYNLSQINYVGFCNYNKALKLNSKTLNFLFLGDCDWITFEPINIVKHSCQEEVNGLKKVLKKYPDYYNAWERLYNDDGSSKGDVCRYANTFLTSKNEFYAYCEFLFDVLSKLRNEVGDKNDCSKNDKRYCAYMAERLLSVYLFTNGKKAVSVQQINKQWYLKPVRKLVNVFRINKNSPFYLFFKKRYGYRSSYNEKVR